MKEYTSWGYTVDIELKDERSYKNVLLCPNPMQKGEHILEFHNGECISVETDNLKSITNHELFEDTFIQ